MPRGFSLLESMTINHMLTGIDIPIMNYVGFVLIGGRKC